MLNDDLFKKAKLTEPERCCAALRNNHRCPNANGSLGENLICDDHVDKLSRGEWVRIYKQSKLASTDLGAAFASLRKRRRAENENSKRTASGGNQTTKSDLPSSWFSNLLSPQAVGTILFLAAVYFAEMIKLAVIDAPGALTLSNAASYSLAMTNVLSVLLFIALILFWLGLFVGLLILLLLCARRFCFAVGVWFRCSLPSIGLRTIVFGRSFLAGLGLEVIAALPNRLRPPDFDRETAVTETRESRDLASKQIYQVFHTKVMKMRSQEDGRREKLRNFLSRASSWYRNEMLLRKRSSPILNWAQGVTISSLFCATVVSSWFGATQFNQALNENLCTPSETRSVLLKDPLSWLDFPINSYRRLNPHIGSVDCGYLVFETRRESLSSVLSPASQDGQSKDGSQGLYSEQVAYIGDYGEWSLVVPASRPAERVLIRRSAIQEFAPSEPVNGLKRLQPQTSESLEVLLSPIFIQPQQGTDRSIRGQQVSWDALIALLFSSATAGASTDPESSNMSELGGALRRAEVLIANISETIGDFNSLIDKLREPITIDVQPKLVAAEAVEPSEFQEFLFPSENGPMSIQARIELVDEPFATSNLELSAVLNGRSDDNVLEIPSRLDLANDSFKAPQDALTDLLNNPAEASPLQLSTQLRIDGLGADSIARSHDSADIGDLQANLSINTIVGLRGAVESALSEPFELKFEQSDLDMLDSCSELKASVYFQVGSYDTLEARHGSKNLETIESFVNQINLDDLVILRGHTDPVGPASANLNLAERRAENVRDVLSKRFPEATIRIGAMPIRAQTSEQLWSGIGSRSDVTDDEMRRVDLLSCSSSEVFAGDQTP